MECRAVCMLTCHAMAASCPAVALHAHVHVWLSGLDTRFM